MHELDTNQSITATVCEQAALFGAVPDKDDFDSREVWDQESALSAVTEAFGIIARCVAPDGTQLADERESLLWGFVNMLDVQTQRLDREADRLVPEMRDLQREQDGSEIRSRELELVTDRARNLTERRDAFEQMRDTAAEAYRVETGEVWRPRRGSHTSRTGHLTSAMIEARDFQRAAGTGRIKPSCHRERWWRWQEGSRPRTRVRSSVTWTGSRPSTTTWSWSTEEGRALRRSRPGGRSGTGCTRSCASRTGTPTAGPLPSAGTTSCWTCCPRG